MRENTSDAGLIEILKEFKTMYPYLRHIAESNKIKDPFDERVVEAYWLGNNLLETINKKNFYQYLIDAQKMKKRLSAKAEREMTNEIYFGATPYHLFHVLKIWKNRKDYDSENNIEKIDNCRVSWGKIKKIDGPLLFIETKPLLYINNQLILGQPTIKKINRIFNTHQDIEGLKIGDIISIHWNMPCETITPIQTIMLEKYTLHHINIVNHITHNT